MTTRRAVARKVEEEIANAGITPHDNQAPVEEQDHLGDQAPVNTPAMIDGTLRETFLN